MIVKIWKTKSKYKVASYNSISLTVGEVLATFDRYEKAYSYAVKLAGSTLRIYDTVKPKL